MRKCQICIQPSADSIMKSRKSDKLGPRGHPHAPPGWSVPLWVLCLAACAGCATSTSSVKSTGPAGQPDAPSSWSRPHFSPDGTRLAALRNGQALHEFALPHDLAGREVPLPFSGLGPTLIDLNYGADGDLLVLCQVTNTLTLLNAHKRTALAHRPLHGPVLGGLLSRDGKHAVIYFEGTPGRTNMHVSLVDWNSGKDIVILPEHQGIRCLALSGDGRRLATVDAARLNRIWDAETGALLLTLPANSHKSVGIALDQQGARVAAACAQISVQGLEQTNQPVGFVPEAGPKPGTVVGGAGVVLVAVAFAAIGSPYIGWNPHWFNTPPTIGLSLSPDGQRVATLNSAPNFKGEFQVRLADPRTGRPEVVYGLSPNFLPWAVFRDSGAMVTYEVPGDRTAGQPVFSPSGFQLAVPGNGVRVLDFTSPANIKDIWLGKSKLPPAYIAGDRHQIRCVYNVEPVRAVNSVSWLARATHRQVCLEATVNASQTERWLVPLGLGMKKVFMPSLPVSDAVNQSLKTVWQDCGHKLVEWDAEVNLASRVLRWQLDTAHSLAKGWDLTAMIEIELKLSDKEGTVLHSARYTGKDHQIKKWEPSESFISKMQARALEACLAEMKNDPKWEPALAIGRPQN